MSEINCKVFGKVQMVFYRAFIKDVANKLGLIGTVKNLEDGSVEIIAQGNDDLLKDFLEEVRGGSPLSQVDSIDVNWSDKETKMDLEEFIIIH